MCHLTAASISHAFLASLNEVQHTPWQPAVGSLINQVQQVRESEAARHASPLESVTIDIVAMLFDFVFNDDELPATVKSLVGAGCRYRYSRWPCSTQVSSPTASTRAPPRFLDGITGIALHWGAGGAEDDPFLAHLATLVSRIRTSSRPMSKFSAKPLSNWSISSPSARKKRPPTLNVAAEAVSPARERRRRMGNGRVRR
jgi:hypothetical protein